jgi:hypothetical protein
MTFVVSLAVGALLGSVLGAVVLVRAVTQT